uniref:Methyltransf_11 domain-containing protein n=1 Tax=Caenorhabditis japonica TaxID=281687 RepID=A0A8R1HYB8_CAEJA
MSITSENVEREYVHSTYSRLASYQQNTNKATTLRIWPGVRKFVDKQANGSVILDVGCGEAKYTSTKCHVIGFDTCPEILFSNKKIDIDLCLANALSIPIRDASVDAILNVSVIHHLSTPARRRQALQECCRCLRVGGQMMIYAWAFEQPNGKFASQDILVPWNMHETMIGGRFPKVKFHLNTTKEHRVISASIPVNITENSTSFKWYNEVLNKLSIPTLMASLTKQFSYFSKQCSTPVNGYSYANVQSTSTSGTDGSDKHLPFAVPQYLPTKSSIISGIRRWSPRLGKRLASLAVPVEEQFGEELARTIMRESITEAVATFREVTFYRFYHVFKEGELASFVNSIDELSVVSASFEHGNWCVVAEKVPSSCVKS